MEIFNEKIVRMIRLYLSGAISEEERQELLDKGKREEPSFF